MRLLLALVCLLPWLASCRQPAQASAALEVARALAPAPPAAMSGDDASAPPTAPAAEPLKVAASIERAPGELAPDQPALPSQAAVEVAPIAKADYSIAEVRAQKKALSGKAFEVRARVTKVNLNIMGKTWLHLRDGSEPGELTVTSPSSAAVGDVVRVRGTLGIDRGIAAGYSFEIIMEDAVIQLEEPANAGSPAPSPPPAGHP